MPACCEHDESDHGQERHFFYTESRREVCLMCPGYETEDGQLGYPHGKAWHRLRVARPLTGGNRIDDH